MTQEQISMEGIKITLEAAGVYVKEVAMLL